MTKIDELSGDRYTRAEPYGAVVYAPSVNTTIRLDRDEAREMLDINEFPEDLTAPEIVHLEVSDECLNDCDYCYVDKEGDELSTYRWMEIMDELKEAGVFELTFGGGEPFQRDGIINMAKYAKNELGMGTSVTTEGTWLDTRLCGILAGGGAIEATSLRYFDQINFSFHGEQAIYPEDANLAMREADKRTDVGINFVLKKSYRGDLKEVAEFCKEKDYELLLLSYKPVNGDTEEAIDPHEVFCHAKALALKGVPVAVDGMTCNTCTAAERFVTIDSTGDVFPCSFIREPIGNVTEEPFEEIWERREKPENCPYL